MKDEHRIPMKAPCGAAKTCFECPYPDCSWTGRDTPEAFRAAKERQRERAERDEKNMKKGANNETMANHATKDICETCKNKIKNYVSVIGTISWCCEKHWHCKPGSIASDYTPEKQEFE